jgi:hypothetical protein
VTTIQYIVGIDAGANDYSPLLIELSIYNIKGQKITTLVSEKQTPGKYSVQWDAPRLGGIASGIYFYRLKTDKGFTQARRLVFLK